MLVPRPPAKRVQAFVWVLKYHEKSRRDLKYSGKRSELREPKDSMTVSYSKDPKLPKRRGHSPRGLWTE